MQAVILDQKLKSLVASERKITHEILLLIQTLDITKSFRELGYSSLFEYLVKEIGYSESSAQRRISSARLMKQVPQIADDLKSGNLNLTQVALAQVAIRQEEKARSQMGSTDEGEARCAKISLQQKIDILDKMKSKNTFETQKILKENLPAFEIPKPKTIPAEKDKVHVTLQFSESDWNKVQALMAHFSHTIPDQKIESLLLHWQAQVEKKKQKQLEKVQNETIAVNDLQILTVDEMKPSMNPIDLKDLKDNKIGQKMKSSDILLPLRMWNQNAAAKTKSSDRFAGRESRSRRFHMPSRIHIQVRSQAQDRCEYVSKVTGRRCASKHFLETEHRIPIAKGGANDIQNLRLFCRSHNALAAKLQGVSQV